MDDLTAYFAAPIHHPYYEPTAPSQPPPPGTVQPSAASVVQSIHIQPEILAYSPQVLSYSPQDLVRTLFIAGLPEDVKPREIYNLFREFPGYQSSNLRPPTSSNCQPFAFATFLDQQSAVLAMHALNGLVFDLEKGSTLYIDLAKSNSRSKRQRTDEDRQGSEKKTRGPVSFSPSFDSAAGSFHITGVGSSAYNTIGYPSAQSSRIADDAPISVMSSKSNNTPCPTLFVANLSPTCSEEELTMLFSRCRGFLKLKMQSTYGAPVAFVDFKDTACSTEALGHLQGTILYSSGEAMRLEYARSRMGQRSKKSR